MNDFIVKSKSKNSSFHIIKTHSHNVRIFPNTIEFCLRVINVPKIFSHQIKLVRWTSNFKMWFTFYYLTCALDDFLKFSSYIYIIYTLFIRVWIWWLLFCWYILSSCISFYLTEFLNSFNRYSSYIPAIHQQFCVDWQVIDNKIIIIILKEKKTKQY